MRAMLTTCLTAGLLALIGFSGVQPAAGAPAGNRMVVVEKGKALAPIVIFKDAPPFTRRAADELALYIEKTSGAKMQIIEGLPEPLPARAIWVGYQPKLKELFPKLDFDFKHPEEILIACDGSNLVIAGRDIWKPEHLRVAYPKPLAGANPGGGGAWVVNGVQQEYGTANAVYTFLQDYLGMRWFWPGESGEDVLRRETIAFEPFEYRYHPQFRGRAGIFFHSHMAMADSGHSQDWTRLQRLQLDSLWVQPWHPFASWWDRFHKTNPDFFALQPDGTRSGWPGPRGAKLCKSNPAVWEEWLKGVEAQIQRDPNQTVFSAAANDGGAQGFCVCEKCRAWDPPKGEMVTYRWKGVSQDRVGLADRQITFANHLGRMLKARYPDKDYYVSIMAYGNSRPAPVQAVPDDNVIVAVVFNFHNRYMLSRGDPAADHRRMFLEWSRAGVKNLAWRPNLGGSAGWQLGMPNVAMRRAIEDMRLVAESNVISITFDTIWEHWATQGPHYYVLAQMAWNPYADGNAILADYYQRAFGPAANAMKDYWAMMEQATDEILFKEKPTAEVWNDAFYRRAYSHLDRAEKAVAGAPVHARRVAFVRAGLDYMGLYYDTEALIARLRKSGGKDDAARAAAQANWEKLAKIFAEHPTAFDPHRIAVPTGKGGPGRMRRIHPDSYDK